MLQAHKDIFFDAAQQFTCWIGLREPNELSDRWVGKRGYRPKGEACKAKTSDNEDFPFAGLVVDPILCPTAFSSEKALKDAQECWNTKFLVGGNLPPGFGRLESGPEKGLVRQQGQAIHADYDLMAISRAGQRGEHLFTSNAEEKALFAKVGAYLNQRFGTPLIQHGTEFMWDGGVGARESEYVLWFGPGRKLMRTQSSMPKGGH
jgi:hypothetical protein